jgi:DNA-binding CsgD family transcriptional regulator
VAYLQGDYSAARSLCEEGLVTSKDIGSTYNIAISMAALGGIAAATGQPQRGARLLGAADALLQGIGSVLEAENRRPYQAGVASARAQLGEAEFEKAMHQGRSMLMEQAIAYALDPTLLPTEEPSAPVQAPASSPAPELGTGSRTRYPEGLTRREVEVLRVLAEGLSNAQIAQRLFLSPNTVNVHLYSIFSKLGVTTRTAAARFAVERKLV